MAVVKYRLPCLKVSPAGQVRQKCVHAWRERPAHQQPHAEKEQREQKVAFKSLSGKTTDCSANGYFHTQLRLTLGVSLFSF